MKSKSCLLNILYHVISSSSVTTRPTFDMKGGEASLRDVVSKNRKRSLGNCRILPLGRVTGILSSVPVVPEALISSLRLKSIKNSVYDVCKTSLLFVFSMNSSSDSLRG
jgi:hypothetical protein